MSAQQPCQNGLVSEDHSGGVRTTPLKAHRGGLQCPMSSWVLALERPASTCIRCTLRVSVRRPERVLLANTVSRSYRRYVSVKCGYCKKIGTIDHVRNCPQRYGGPGRSRGRGGVSNRNSYVNDGPEYDESYAWSVRGHAIDEEEPLRIDGVDLRSRLDDDEDWDQLY